MTPIFVITCDRLECLKKSLWSYNEFIKTPFEIVIVDFKSTYKPTIEFLKSMESMGIKVYWEDKINTPEELNKANICIQDYFKSHPETNYVVTDPDVALDNVKGNVLEIYSFFLETFSAASVVGPMLRIDDIPTYYPFRNEILSGRMGLHKGFHSQKVHNITHDGNKIEYITAPIDSTFGMCRAGAYWIRCRRGLRILSPYAARHLDWYVDPKNLTPDQGYYMKHASKQIAHWSRGEE